MQRTYTTLTILFTAFLSSVFVYLLLGYLLRTMHQPGYAPEVAEPLFFALLLVSFSNLVIAQMIRQRSFGDGSAKFDTPEKLHAYITSRYIVIYALSEVPAIFGLIYFLLTGIFWRLGLFAGLSVISFFLVRPSLPALEDFQRRNNAG